MKKVSIVLALGAAFALAVSTAQAYVVILKDGSKIFARSKYEVKGANAIITLENGNITQIPLAQVNVAESDTYNKENVGNVIAIETPKEKTLDTPKESDDAKQNLSQFIRKHQADEAAPKAKESSSGSAGSPQNSAGGASGDSVVAREAARILEGAGVKQYRLAPGPKVTIIATDEDAVFKALAAAARLTIDLSSLGKGQSLDVFVVSPKGEDGGHFKMTPDGVAALNAGSVTPSEFFVTNVIF